MGSPWRVTMRSASSMSPTWFGIAAFVGAAVAIQRSVSSSQQQTGTDVVGLHDEGMPSKHDKCKMNTFGGSKKALPDGTYANYWCTGSVRCTRGFNVEEIKCEKDETY